MRTHERYLVILAAGLLTLLSSMAQAGLVAITNPGFEDSDLSSSPYYNPTISGWNVDSGWAGEVLAEIGPPSQMFSQGGFGGSNVAYSTITVDSGDSLFGQVVGTITENTRYTMTVKVGDRDLPSTYDGNLPSTIHATLDGLVPVSSSTPTPANGGFATWTMVYDVLPGNTSVGNDLKLLLGSDGVSSDPVTQVQFDDVTLSVSSLGSGSPSDPVMLPITNAGFEDSYLYSVPGYYNNTISGWIIERGWAGEALTGPASTLFSQGGYGGANVTYSTITDTSGPSQFSQVVGTIAENTKYTMTVKVGDRDRPSSYDGNLPSTILAKLDGLVPVSSSTPTPVNGGMATWTMVYEVLPGSVSVGNDLKLILGSDGVGSDPVTQVQFDDVTLTAESLGTVPDPEPIKVFVLAGQSNMYGSAASSALTPPLSDPLADVQIYAGHNPGWKDLAPGTTYFGPEIGFGHEMIEGLDGEPIMLIKYASGGTNLAVQWNPDTPGTEYANLWNTVNAAIASLPGEYEAEYAGFLWMQGEADAQNAAMAAAYGDNLENFIAKVREDFGDPDLPFALGRIAPNEQYWPVLGDLVRDAQAAAAANIDHVTMIDTDDLTKNADGVHYDTAGSLELGRRFANAMFAELFTPGDANGDGYVNVSDLGILATNYGGGSGLGWGDADFTLDGVVDVSDLGLLATNYGTVPDVQSVPEPGSLILLLGVIMAVTNISPRSRQ